MILDYICACGQTHSAKSRDIRFLQDGVGEIFAYVTNYVKAGSIALVYDAAGSELAGDVSDRLERSGYKVHTTVYTGADYDILTENNELVIGIGGSDVAEKLRGDKCVFVATGIADSSPFRRSFRGILIDRGAVAHSPMGEIAGGYGTLMTKLLSILDYRMYASSCHAGECAVLLDKIEECILNFFEKDYIYFKDDAFVRDLTDCIVQIGIYEGMLTDCTLLDSYDRVSDNTRCVIDRGLCRGESDMLVGWYGYNILKAVFAGDMSNLCYPADIMSDCADLSVMTSRPQSEILGNIGKIDAAEITKNRYILNEYRADISEYLSGIWGRLERAMKNFRRIYYDAGLSIVMSVTLDKLSAIISRSAVEIGRFSLLKSLRLDGVI